MRNCKMFTIERFFFEQLETLILLHFTNRYMNVSLTGRQAQACWEPFGKKTHCSWRQQCYTLSALTNWNPNFSKPNWVASLIIMFMRFFAKFDFAYTFSQYDYFRFVTFCVPTPKQWYFWYIPYLSNYGAWFFKEVWIVKVINLRRFHISSNCSSTKSNKSCVLLSKSACNGITIWFSMT